MVDNYAKATVFIRVIAIILLLAVLYQQHRELSNRKDSNIHALKWLLLSLVAVIIGGNIISIVVNSFRRPDGNLITTVRHISMVWNAVSAIATGVILNLIYTYKG